MKIPLTTEARIFANQMGREIVARERTGAGLLAPGATDWRDALKIFAHAMRDGGGPRQAAAIFHAGMKRLRQAQKDGCCFINCFLVRKRSGFCELLTYERDTHPLIGTRHEGEGITVNRYLLQLHRGGNIAISFGTPTAYISWHALGRMRERSRIDIFGAGGVVGLCGMVGILARESEKHRNTELNLAVEDMVCSGVLRITTKVDGKPAFGFFDVFTVLPTKMWQGQEHKRAQGIAFGHAVLRYLKSDDSAPLGYCDAIPVIAARETDYVSRELKQTGGGSTLPL